MYHLYQELAHLPQTGLMKVAYHTSADEKIRPDMALEIYFTRGGVHKTIASQTMSMSIGSRFFQLFEHATMLNLP